MGIEPEFTSEVPFRFTDTPLDGDPLYPYEDDTTYSDVTLDPSNVAQYLSFDGCPQFFKYQFDDDVNQRVRQSRDFKEAFEPLDVLLVKDGNEFEEDVVDHYDSQVTDHDDRTSRDNWKTTRSDIVDWIQQAAEQDANPSDPKMLTQLRLGGVVGVWPLAGDADIVFLWPTDDGVRIRILDVKASHEERTYQQVQVAVYSLLLRRFLLTTELADADFDITIEGGIIHRGSDLDAPTPDDLPEFELRYQELDVFRLLQEDGTFEELHEKPNEEINYQLGRKCNGCSFKEACHTHAIEEASTALLGLSRGEQEALASEGVTTIHDLAEVAYPPEDPRPYEYDELTIRNEDTYESLLDDPSIGQKLPRLIQMAQSFLAKYDPTDLNAASTDDVPWIVGSGKGNLPEDNPPFDADFDFEEGSMIRTYLHVQHDHRRDRVMMLNGFITATNYDGDPIQISKVVDEIPDTQEEADDREAELLEEFLSELFDGIREVGDRMGGRQAKFSPAHFYLYTGHERDTLVEATGRHTEYAPEISAMRDFLGLRADIDQHPTDQAMVSVVQNEVKNRVAMPHRNHGLLAAVNEFYPYEDAFPHHNWTYERSDGNTIDLRDAFREKFFDYRVPMNRDDGEIQLAVGGGVDNPDGFYPSRVRGGAQIPLQYLWAVCGKLTEEWISDIRNTEGTDDRLYQPIEPYKTTVTESEERVDLTHEDLRALGQRLAHCVAHVERSLTYRNTELEKQTINLDQLEDFSHGDFGIARVCREFLDLEYNTQRKETRKTYALPVEQRVRSGESIPFVIDEMELHGGSIEIEGRLLYSAMFENGDRIAHSSRPKGGDGTTSGSWMVASRLNRDGTPADSDTPDALERATRVTIEDLDPTDEHIELSANRYRTGDKDYVKNHAGWEVGSASERDLLFEEGGVYILDPQTDDINAQRAGEVLDNSYFNPVANLLDDLVDGVERPLSIDTFDEEAVDDFADWLDENYDPSPNEKQQEFITETDGRVSLLQGPPGTGKTSGALAPAIVSRVYAFSQQNQPLTGVVSGSSNKAIDEILEDVAGVANHYRENSDGDEFDDLMIARLTSEEPEDPIPGVEYINYSEDESLLWTLANRIINNSVEDGKTQPHVLLFTTPSRFYGVMDRVTDIDIEELLEAGEQYFDLLAIDEASMMRLPELLTVGAFLRDDAQMMIGGDQRQMPPVIQHDWEQEARRTVEELAPYLSALNYLRLIDGQDVEKVDEEKVRDLPDVDIPMTQLEITYRCHTVVADFLQENLYKKDGINYRSNVSETLPEIDADTEGIQSVLDPEHPVVLILHDEMESQQANPVEAAMSLGILEQLGFDGEDEESLGGVTPHNAQRGMLSSFAGDTTVDTVERFQGGEENAILVSATASDPDFLESESDFILNPNRLNVSMSRMQEKLIVVASRSVFDLVPKDVDKYRRAQLWKGLYDTVGVIEDSPEWNGTLDEFLGDAVDAPGLDYDEDAGIEVYTVEHDPDEETDAAEGSGETDVSGATADD